MNYTEENQKLGENFLQRYFDVWKNGGQEGDWTGNWNRIEFESTFGCVLNCKYCYLNNYQDELEPDSYDMSQILERGKMLTDWLVENDYSPTIDFFGGSPLVFEENIEMLDYMLERLSQLDDPGPIVVPSSYVWIGNDERVQDVERLLKKSRETGVPLSLSTSIDGKYCDDNRPTSYVDRDEDYYDKVFEFNSKYGFGYHPMIYSDHIEDWEDNWLWFIRKLREYNQPPELMYLLEVRNPEWSKGEIKEFGEFIKFLLDWTLWYQNYDRQDFMNYLFEEGYNILRPFARGGRGLGCSMQSTVMVQLADFSIKPCHRTAYEEMQLAHYETDGEQITGIEIDNPALLIGHTAAKQEVFPMCEQCSINHLCSGGCLGANYEETGSMFTQIPTVCQLEHEKMYAMYEWYDQHDLLEELYDRIDPESIQDFESLSQAGGML